MPRNTKQAATIDGPKCLCGCGDVTKGGRFLPGHDARYKSALVNKARGGGRAADAAKRRLVEMGWEKYIPTNGAA